MITYWYDYTYIPVYMRNQAILILRSSGWALVCVCSYFHQVQPCSDTCLLTYVLYYGYSLAVYSSGGYVDIRRHQESI